MEIRLLVYDAFFQITPITKHGRLPEYGSRCSCAMENSNMDCLGGLLSCKDVYAEAESEFWKYVVIDFPFCHKLIKEWDGLVCKSSAYRFELLGLPKVIPTLCERLIQNIAKHSNLHRENSLGHSALVLESKQIQLHCK